MLEQLQDFFTPQALYALGSRGLRILIILIAALIAVRIVRRALPRLSRLLANRMSSRAGQTESERDKRAETLSSLVNVTAVTVLWIVATIMLLKEAGFDVAPILAGAGVVGLAVGFGAQNLVRDVITGALMLLENQVRVGDVAVINGQGGLVERINLRTIVLRGLDGTVHVVPNGAVTSLSNMTYEFSFYVFDVGVAYKEDTDRVVEVLEGLGADLQGDAAFADDILEPLEILGVDSFGDSAVIIKARFKTKPIKQWRVGREMNRRIKKRFDELGIEIPFPHRSIYFGEQSAPFQLLMSQGNGQRSEIAQQEREPSSPPKAGARA
jgi:small-conductance mechanosensitive channel